MQDELTDEEIAAMKLWLRTPVGRLAATRWIVAMRSCLRAGVRVRQASLIRLRFYAVGVGMVRVKRPVEG